MDPNVVLANASQAVADMRVAPTDDDYLDDAARLGDTFSTLDDWLSKGGFLPPAWSDARQETVKQPRQACLNRGSAD